MHCASKKSSNCTEAQTTGALTCGRYERENEISNIWEFTEASLLVVCVVAVVAVVVVVVVVTDVVVVVVVAKRVHRSVSKQSFSDKTRSQSIQKRTCRCGCGRRFVQEHERRNQHCKYSSEQQQQ